MTYREFTEKVEESILGYLPFDQTDADVMINEMVKTNDQKLFALCIRMKDDQTAPLIYLESFYRMYTEGDNMDTVMRQIAHAYLQSEKERKEMQVCDINEYDSIRKQLYMVVLNKDSNQEYLKNACSRDIPGTDITSAVRVLCGEVSKNGYASFLVKDSLLERWGVSRDEVLDEAFRNTCTYFPAELKNIRDVLKALGVFEGRTDEEEIIQGLQPYEQYVLTNTAELHGATVMFYPEVLKNISEATNSNIFILPSSVHEVILIKDNGDMSADELQRMVMEINRTQIKPGEVLSDEVYYYDYREQKLVMATDRDRTRELVMQMEADYGDETDREWPDETDKGYIMEC